MRGRSKGTAEVVFALQTDILAAIKRYNNVQLDGKPLKIELVGVNVITPVPVLVTTTTNLAKPNNFIRSVQERIGARRRGYAADWPGATARETPCREAYCRST
ncbi:PREDICTED: THO complex subunit 4B-like [Populus euphratica]|uniref:THO complex subunit 4B-like n=1 Tax=Populus euphratica TaxID=75702 RepID=A0AAJ6U9Q9_POPEU|nr:PREDICTED: THO complex subunit 4B-like [Populus euphratica]XP_011025802.1 PREDICTED: THO complex subunit 4B-like [Populus euphratica]XP_011025879.1 PREDICTED: THO complex subunit 4B-like [Populus euphratica]XP_011025957.1 PREDICTED: THO complex subunit 4B-like [Populus euphratica]